MRHRALSEDFNGYLSFVDLPIMKFKEEDSSTLCVKLMQVDSKAMIDSRIIEHQKKETLYEYCAKRNIFL